MTDNSIKRMVDKLITDVGGVPPPDLTKRTTIGGMDPDKPEHRELKANGQQKDYVILSAEERKRGFVRPVRQSYKHVVCGGVTTMGQALAETYARDPTFYSGTFCCDCGKHFPLVVYTDDKPMRQFMWAGTDEGVGA